MLLLWTKGAAGVTEVGSGAEPRDKRKSGLRGDNKDTEDEKCHGHHFAHVKRWFSQQLLIGY